MLTTTVAAVARTDNGRRESGKAAVVKRAVRDDGRARSEGYCEGMCGGGDDG